MVGNAQNIYLESKILSADRVELVQILYQGAIESVETARRCLKQRDIHARVKEINKALAILSELTVSLNDGAGGDLSRRLRALYDYMQRRLIEANFQQSDPPLAEVSKLLATVLEGWMNSKEPTSSPAAQVSPASPPPAPAPPEHTASAYAPQGYSSYAPPPQEAPAYKPYMSHAYVSPDYASPGDGSEERESEYSRLALSY